MHACVCVCIIYKIIFENVMSMYSVFVITVHVSIYMHVVLEGPRGD